METEIIMYSRTASCPFVTLAKRVLNDYAIPFREIMIDQDDLARDKVRTWTGFMAVPTLVVARCGEMMPYLEPSPLPVGTSPRGIDRGAMITEPNINQLTEWLLRHGSVRETDLERK